MFIGFDYGSANCAVGIMENEQFRLLPLSKNSHYLSSTLYALDRDLICEAVLHGLPTNEQAQYRQLRRTQLARAAHARRELDLRPDEPAVFVGEQAIEAYLDMPDEGFYVRSPKSFLGAIGLRQDQMSLFEDIVTLMMQYIKRQAESHLSEGQSITHAVIGRPVNFQGIGGEQSNQQAEAVLRIAAQRAGFHEVAFLFEPIAAGMDYEARLEDNKTVLVVDVGGGTTDCSVVKMGPAHSQYRERNDDFLGHSGQRVGGNDLDIALSMAAFMPHLGLGSLMNNQLPMPNQPFWNAVAVNDVSAQRDFSSLGARRLIESLITDAQQPELLARLLKVQQQQLGYQLVRSAESAKIALSEKESVTIDLSYISADVEAKVNDPLFENAIEMPLTRIEALMNEALTKAKVMPDVIYVTGGTARSPAIYRKISSLYPNVTIVVGDHFSSVTAGLTRWAHKVFAS
ncbi:molecular chaperone [Shewanella surugensis]|uniref:Molecular chaperone n=1 Tax=Shewanella surugensis TaxID=212020 RepID=A0ABT0LIY1_9GAMM|nr:molecular chaperone [Shewanella surugensis]MCL1127646.1 molecular chaperone [Shewanella surugensis]